MSVTQKVLEKAGASIDATKGIPNQLKNDDLEAKLPAYDSNRDSVSGLHSEAIVRSSTIKTLADKDVQQAVDALDREYLPKEDLAVNAQVEMVLEKDDPNNPGHLLYARYFAQTGGRSGFNYMLQTQLGLRAIEFEQGLYTTTDKNIISQLQNDIKSNPSISRQIQEISEGHYKDMFEKSSQAAAILARTGGMTTSVDIKQDNVENAAAKSRIIAEQEKRIKELEAELNTRAKSGELAVPDAGKTPFKFGKDESKQELS